MNHVKRNYSEIYFKWKIFSSEKIFHCTFDCYYFLLLKVISWRNVYNFVIIFFSCSPSPPTTSTTKPPNYLPTTKKTQDTRHPIDFPDDEDYQNSSWQINSTAINYTVLKLGSLSMHFKPQAKNTRRESSSSSQHLNTTNNLLHETKLLH